MRARSDTWNMGAMDSLAVARYLNVYCERGGGAGLLAEPLNALTNVAFFAAAFLAARRLAARARHAGPSGFLEGGRDDPTLRVAVGLLGAVGVGSTLWHTLAVRWAQAADAIPVFVLLLLLLGSTLRHLFDLSPRIVAAWLTAFVMAHAVIGLALPPRLLDGSLFYLPTWLALGGLALAGSRRGVAAASFASGWAIFSASLALRTLDRWACGLMPTGTHFAWHLLNAWLLYRMLALLIRRPYAGASAG